MSETTTLEQSTLPTDGGGGPLPTSDFLRRTLRDVNNIRRQLRERLYVLRSEHDSAHQAEIRTNLEGLSDPEAPSITIDEIRERYRDDLTV